jgi:hypothetical protein
VDKPALFAVLAATAEPGKSAEIPFGYHLNWAIVELAADSRQPLRRYSGLCAVTASVEDAVRSAIPEGFAF